MAAAGLLGVSEPRAVALVHAAGTGAVLALLQQPISDRDAALADAMLEAVLGAILTASPAPPASDIAALAIAFRTAIPGLSTLTDGERVLLTEWIGRTIDDLSN